MYFIIVPGTEGKSRIHFQNTKKKQYIQASSHNNNPE